MKRNKQKLVLARRAVRDLDAARGGFGGFGGGGGGFTGGGGFPTIDFTDLTATLENKDASPDDIKAKLTALREAREKAKTELAAAQKELKDVLTQRQEATLVNMSMLE